MYGGTPWGYIHQKKKTEEAYSEVSELRRKLENQKEIIRHLLEKKELTKKELDFLNEEKII